MRATLLAGCALLLPCSSFSTTIVPPENSSARGSCPSRSGSATLVVMMQTAEPLDLHDSAARGGESVPEVERSGVDAIDLRGAWSRLIQAAARE